MTKSEQAVEVTPMDPAAAVPNLRATLLRVAWLSILLGFAMEALILLLAAGVANVPSLKPIVADLVQKVSWSVFVCVGLAIGTAASKARAPVMGLMGLLSAPLAFNAARFLHKSTAHALAIAGPAVSGPSPYLLGLIKGAEYGCLGSVLGWLGRRPWGGAVAHIGAGLGVGLLFGGVVLALTAMAVPSPLSPAALLVRGVNEVLFPIGCSLVLFAAEALGKRVE